MSLPKPVLENGKFKVLKGYRELLPQEKTMLGDIFPSHTNICKELHFEVILTFHLEYWPYGNSLPLRHGPCIVQRKLRR